MLYKVTRCGPESHAPVECRVGMDAFDSDADGAGACQRTEVFVRRIPRSQEPDLEVLRLMRPRCSRHGNGYQDNQHRRNHFVRFYGIGVSCEP